MRHERELLIDDRDTSYERVARNAEGDCFAVHHYLAGVGLSGPGHHPE